MHADEKKEGFLTVKSLLMILEIYKQENFPFSLFVCGSGSHDDYEYMRKFSSNDDSINHSSPTSSFQYPVYSQLDKNGEFDWFSLNFHLTTFHLIGQTT